MSGPPPKRSDQRRRRNKVDVDKAVPDGLERAPKLTGKHSAAARRFWEALSQSGQAQFFEPSDWAAAELVVLAIDEFRRNPSGSMLSSISSMMSNLLVTEGDRRRLRLELERRGDAGEQEDTDVAWLDDARARLRGAAE